MYRVFSKSFRLKVYLRLVHIIKKHVVGIAIVALLLFIFDIKWCNCWTLNHQSQLTAGKLQQPAETKIIANPFNSLVISNRMKRLVRDILVRASRPWYFVLKTQLLNASISKSNKALDYVPEIFINQPFLGKRFIILDIKSITPRSITSDRYTCRSCNRQITRENINLNSLTKTTICTNLLSISSSRGMEIEPFVQTL